MARVNYNSVEPLACAEARSHMNQLATPEKLKLEVQNFGPIVSAELDLRPLTVFVGPSNVGKSYLATAIYGLHKFFAHSPNVRLLAKLAEAKLPQHSLEQVADWMRELQQSSSGSIAANTFELPQYVLEAICKLLEIRSDYLNFQLCRCFAVGQAQSLIRAGKNQEARLRAHTGSFLHEVEIRPEAFEVTSNPVHQAKSQTTLILKDVEAEVLRRALEGTPLGREPKTAFTQPIWRFLSTLVDCLLPELAGALRQPIHYLPASRSGLMNTQRVIAGSMVSLAGFYEADHAPIAPMLTGVATDFIRQLIEIDQAPSVKSLAKFGDGVETSILGGRLRVESSTNGGLPHFSYRPRGFHKSISLLSASSMVSELAPLVLYLRHVVQQGETLIIEEPESHLHPKAQVDLTRQLAKLVQEGIKVLITTHSEWVLEALGNLMRVSSLSESQSQGLQDAEFALDPEQVGVWSFKQQRSPKGSIVEEVVFNVEKGGLETEFDQVAEDVYNSWATMENRIAERSP